MNADEMRKFSRLARRRRFRRRTLTIVLISVVGFWLADKNFRPLVFALAEARSASMASQALAGALQDALGDGIGYEDLMHVRMDERGQVALLSANTMQMNRLAERAGAAALYRLENMSSERVSVPLGAALGVALFAGTGPGIPISIVPIGSVSTDFATEFEACGINQADLEGKKISLQSGTTAETFCMENNYDISAFTANSDAQLALTTGKVAAWVIDDLTAKDMVDAYNAENPETKLVILDEAMTTEPYAFAFQKGSEDLVNEIDKILKELVADGTIAALFEEYNAPYTAPEN